MPRDHLSETFVASLLARESGVVVLMLLDIEHEDLETPIRIVNNTEDVVSSGNLYTAVGFEVRLPDDRDGTPRGAKIQIDNTTQWLTPTVRTLFGEFLVTIRIAIPTDAESVPPEYDGIEIEYLPMQLTSLRMNETTVEASLSYENLVNDPWPPDTFNPTHFPTLFWSEDRTRREVGMFDERRERERDITVRNARRAALRAKLKRKTGGS